MKGGTNRFCLGPLTAATLLCVFAVVRRPPDNAVPGSLTAFRSDDPRKSIARYVPLEMHNLISGIDEPKDPAATGLLPGFDEDDLGKQDYKPSFRPQGAAPDRLPETDERELGELSASLFPLEITEDTSDHISRALRNWGWLSREVLESEWRREEVMDQVSFLESLLPSETLDEDSWGENPLEAAYGEPLSGTEVPDADSIQLYNSRRQPSQELSRRLFGTDNGKAADKLPAPGRWRPSSAPVAEENLPARTEPAEAVGFDLPEIRRPGF